MKVENQYLEKAISAISDRLYEEAAEYALAGIKQTKNNNKTPCLNKMFTRILSCAAMALNGELKSPKEEDTENCSFCSKNEHEVKLVHSNKAAICNECSELVSDIFKEENK